MVRPELRGLMRKGRPEDLARPRLKAARALPLVRGADSVAPALRVVADLVVQKAARVLPVADSVAQRAARVLPVADLVVQRVADSVVPALRVAADSVVPALRVVADSAAVVVAVASRP